MQAISAVLSYTRRYVTDYLTNKYKIMVEFIAYCISSSLIFLVFIFLVPNDDVWILIKENGKWIVQSKKIKDIKKGDDYYTSYQLAYRISRRLNHW